jgi:hypothetical protein
MTAQIITLPLIRAMNAPKPVSDVPVTMEIHLQRAIMNRLCAAAARAESSVEGMAEALIVWGLAAIEHKSAEEFYSSLDL